MADQELETLLANTALGDRAAFMELYQKSNGKLFAVCMRILQDKTEAEDALQDAYIKIWRYAERYAATRATPMTWMIAITRNHAIDKLRAKRPPAKALKIAESVADGAMRADDRALAKSEAKRLLDCIKGLGEPEARHVRMAYFGGVTYAALAEREGVPLGTLKSRMRKALGSLRECLLR